MTRLNDRQFGPPNDPDKEPNPLFHGYPGEFAEKLGHIPDEVWEGAPVRQVPVAKLVHTQEWLKPGTLEHLVNQPRKKREKPEVIEHEGTLYIHDGHHGASAALLRGQRTIKAKVWRAG